MRYARFLLLGLLALAVPATGEATTASTPTFTPPELMDTIAIGAGGMGVAVDPVTNRVFVSNYHADTISIIDGVTDTVVATIPVGDRGPSSIAVDSDSGRIFVGNMDIPSISVIDGGSDSLIETIPLALPFPAGVAIALNPVTDRIYVTNLLYGTVSAVDANTGAVIATIDVGQGPVGVDVDPIAGRVYVANAISDSVSVIDAGTNTVISTIDVGSGLNPMALVVNPLRGRVYTANVDINAQETGSVSIIDTATGQVTATIPATSNQPGGGNGHGLWVDPATDLVYVTDTPSTNPGFLHIISGETASLLWSLDLDPLAEGVTFNPTNMRTYVAHGGASVSVFGREGDGDGDGFIDGAELYMGTDPLDVCADSPAEDAWPPDRDRDGDADVGDVIASFNGKIQNPADYDPRSDPNGDGDNDIGDVIILYGGGNVLTKCVAFTFTNDTSGDVDGIHIEWSAPIMAVFSALDSGLEGWSDRTLSGDGLTLDLARPVGDLPGGGGTLTVVVQAPLGGVAVATCQWTLDGVDRGTC